MSQGEQRQQPLQAAAAYDGESGTAAEARDFAAGFLTRAQENGDAAVTAQAVDIVRLVVSELITNACKYAPGPCLLDLDIVGDVVQITVWDTQPAVPAVLAHDADRVGQHGLEIVLALCRRLEIERQAGGKRIRVQVPL